LCGKGQKDKKPVQWLFLTIRLLSNENERNIKNSRTTGVLGLFFRKY
jgi:hypothetical protein